ncbi:MAG: hypothetical protein LBU22_07830 [Dysgonamonadaceae bacterium]|jgi:uncharacterized membrane protein SpoIIM required for sporulation|nr:hypothetical protein [Dysgonamonadaceae bacterium]
MKDLVPILIVGFIVLGTYKLFELFIKRKERLAIIEKIFSLSSDKEISGSIRLPEISFGGKAFDFWSLRLALLLMGIGLGCLTAYFVQYNMLTSSLQSYVDTQGDNWQFRNEFYEMKSIIYFACITLFGGAGLLLAYLLELRRTKKN